MDNIVSESSDTILHIAPLTKKKRTVEVAIQLMKIFLMFGTLQILQSDNGIEFTALVLSELKLLLPNLLRVHVKPRHPQSQGLLEHITRDIKDMLISWLANNNTSDWAMGLKLCSFKLTKAAIVGLNKSRTKHSSMLRFIWNCHFPLGLCQSDDPLECSHSNDPFKCSVLSDD